MNNGLSQYKDLYLTTSREYLGALNAALLKLETNPADKEVIEEIFRSAHTLKSQSAAMGYISTGFLCHTIEDVFYEIKEGRLKITPDLADHLFFAFDALKESIDKIEYEDRELDLSHHADTLKKLTGVTTIGAGKSLRGQVVQAAMVEPKQVPKPTATPEPEVKQPAKVESTKEVKTISVKVEVLDEMLNLLEELLIHRLQLTKLARSGNNPELTAYQESTQKIMDSLQFAIMSARAVPVNIVFEHFPRAVRDLARQENKDITLRIEGGELELDRTIIDRLDEPLIHLLRNAVSHGIQTKGTITLAASREKDYALITVADDGQGIDWEALKQKASKNNANEKLNPNDLLFSGISTATEVTQVSGRGVGLKTVKNMVDSFGGVIEVMSEKGKGTSFNIKLPLTLAIAKALIIELNGNKYAIPVLSIDRIVTLKKEHLKKTADQKAFILEEQEVPLIHLFGDTLNEEGDITSVIVAIKGERIGIIVDKVIETSEIVIKPVPKSLKNIKYFSGATILNDGKTALIVNTQEIL